MLNYSALHNFFKDQVEDVTFTIDHDFNLVSVNETGKRILNIQNLDSKLKCYDVICKKHSPCNKNPGSCANEKVLNVDSKYFKINSTELKQSNGKSVYLKILKDLNDYKILEDLKKQLQYFEEQKRQNDLLYDNMNIAFALHEIILDDKGKPVNYTFLDCNQKFELYTGLKKDEIIGKTVLEIMPDVEPYWIETYGKVALSGVPRDYTNYNKASDKYFATKSYSPQKGQFAVTFYDITEQFKSVKLLEKKNLDFERINDELEKTLKKTNDINIELEGALKTLESKERGLKTIFNNAPSIMMLLNDKTEILELNRAGFLVAGKKEAEVIGYRPGDAFTCVNAISQPEGCGFAVFCKHCQIRNAIENTLSTGKDNFKIEAEINIQNKDKTNVKLDLLVSTALIEDSGNRNVLVTIEDVTELKRNERIIKASEEKFKSAFRTSPDSININTLEGNFVDINEGFTKITGFSKEDIVGKNSNDLGIWAIPEDRIKLVEGLMNNGKVENLETIFRCKDGRLITGLMSACFIDIDNTPHILSITRDISDKKLDSFYLQKAQEIGILGTWHINLNSNKIKWTNENYLIYNIDKGTEITYELFYDHVYVEDKDWVEEEWHSAIVNKTFDIEHRIVVDEKIKWVRQKADFIYDTNGKAIEVIGVTQDITTRKESELKLKQASVSLKELNTKLRESEKSLKIKLDTILNPNLKTTDLHLTDLIDIELLQNIQDSFAFATNVASVIVDLNGAPVTQPSNFSELCKEIRKTELGKQKCSISDRRIGEMAILNQGPVITPCLSCGLYDSGTPIIIADKVIAYWMIGQIKTSELTLDQIESYADEIGADKEKVVRSFNDLKLMDVEQFQKIVDHLSIISKELSSLAFNNIQLAKQHEELKIQKKLLRKEKENAEKADHLKSLFLANMSHEIRTPLNGIVGFSELMISRKDMTDEQRAGFGSIIKDCSGNLLNIVNDILDISALDNGTLLINKETFDLKKLFSDLFEIIQQKIHKDNPSIKLILKEEFDINDIYTDKNRFQQIFLNLLVNALKFTQKGQIEFGIYSVDNNFITFFVKDTGIGIREEEFEVIFDRFRQTETSYNRQYGGNGLGLSITKELLKLLEGEIWLESELGSGTCFYFKIPFLTESPDEIEDQNVIPVTTKISSLKALLVEDDDTNAFFIEELLSTENINIVIAKNGKSAIEEARLNNYDLILMDIGLPDINGLDVVREIRSFNPRIPIIAQTAYAMQSDKDAALKAGCNDYITKPIQKDELILRLNRIKRNKSKT